MIPDISNYIVAVPLLAFFVIGAVELVKQAFARNWKSVVIIAVSALVGAVGGWVVLPVIGWQLGLSIGLGASGLVTYNQKRSEGTVSLPSKRTP